LVVQARLDGITTIKTTGEAGSITVPAGEYVELHTVKKECETSYRIR
jgi:hypothetical protein